MPPPAVPSVSKWGNLRRVSSTPWGMSAVKAAAARPPQTTPRWKGQGLAGILDAACTASNKKIRRHRTATAESRDRTESNISVVSGRSDATSFAGLDSQSLASGFSRPGSAKRTSKETPKQLVKRLEKQCDRQKQQLSSLEYEAELNIFERDKLRQKQQELQKQDVEERERCKVLAAKGKTAESQLRALLNAHANAQLDAHLNTKGWIGEIGRRRDALQQMVHSSTQPDLNSVDPRAMEVANTLVTRMDNLRRVHEIKPEGAVAAIGALKRRCNSASNSLGEVQAHEKDLNESIARNNISATMLERDLSCMSSNLHGMQVAASKDAAQFAQYEREKESLQQDLHAARKQEAVNLQRVQVIKTEMVAERRAAQEKLYLSQLEVRRLEDLLRETKDKTSEHIAEAELLAEWEARLPYAHLNQYKMADDEYYKLAGKHHELNMRLREVLEQRKAEFEPSRTSDRHTSHMVAQAW